MNGVTAASPAGADSSSTTTNAMQQKAALFGLNRSSNGRRAAAAAAPAPAAGVTKPAAGSYVMSHQGDSATALPPGVARIVGGATQLFEARTMQQHWDVMRPLLARDVAYQAPIIAAYDREDLRVLAYLAKSIAYMTLEPHLVEVAPAGYNTSIVAVDGTVIVLPKRSWLFPPSLLLPDIPIRATIKLGVRGPLESGQIEFIDGRWHNLPSAPGLVCRLIGLLMGRLMRWAEPLWSKGLWLVGDDSYAKSSSSKADLE